MKKDYDLGMKWNDRLRKARDDAGATDTDIARACDVSNPTVNGWMSGKTINIEARNLLPACKFLGVSPFWIMFGNESNVDMQTLPASLKVGAIDVIRLISLFAQSTDDGKNFILNAAESAEKLPRTP